MKQEIVDSIEKDLKRSLGLRDVFFLSFGGMSPLLSLLTYGAVALEYGGPLAPLIMISGMKNRTSDTVMFPAIG